MRTRTFSWLLLGLSLLTACNDLLDIHPPADVVLDGATGVEAESVRTGDHDNGDGDTQQHDEDAGAG